MSKIANLVFAVSLIWLFAVETITGKSLIVPVVMNATLIWINALWGKD